MKIMNKIMGLLSFLALSALFIEIYSKASVSLVGATDEFIWNMMNVEIGNVVGFVVPTIIAMSITAIACIMFLGFKNIFFILNSVLFSAVVSVLIMLFSNISERQMMYVACGCLVFFTLVGKKFEYLDEKEK